MRAFHCACGSRLFFDNTACLGCARTLGFDPMRMAMVALDAGAPPIWRDASQPSRTYRLCRNYRLEGVCNWLVEGEDSREYCLACDLNEEMPSLNEPRQQLRWRQMEAAKRRLLYTLLALRLPVLGRRESVGSGLAFAFVQDQRLNPDTSRDFLTTGHRGGLITVNMLEADDVSRESTRVEMQEAYRTLLGHFRHESGHYYWERLVRDGGRIEAFRRLFGDERADYQQALQDYYARRAHSEAGADHISAYAGSHPWEDWAETWAHYLHMVDALETARVFDITRVSLGEDAFDDCLREWSRVTLILNELNRSIGQYDAYPFVFSAQIAAKLAFVHESLAAFRQPQGPAAEIAGLPRQGVPSV